MKSPTMVGAYIIFHGDEGEPGPSIVMRRGQIIVMESSEQIRAFAEEHQLIQADIDEMLDMKSLARASTQLEQTIHYQGPST